MREKFTATTSKRLVHDANALAATRLKALGPIRLTILSAVFLSVVVAASTWFYLSDLRNRVLAGNEKNLASSVLIIAKQIEHIFTTIEMVQDEIVRQTGKLGLANSEEFDRKLADREFYVKLHDKAVGMPFVGALTLINAQGRIVNFSRQWPVPDIDTSDRDFFTAFKNDPRLNTFLGQPVQNRATGTWVVHLARRLSAPNGEFLGITSAAIELGYLQEIFSQVALEPGIGFGLFRNDGTLLARIPRVESEIGRRFPNLKSLALVANSDNGIGTSPGIIDGNPRVVAARRVGKYPLVVATAKTLDVALAHWAQTALIATIAACLIIASIAAASLIFIKFFRNHQALLKTRAERDYANMLWEQSTRFDIALNNMSQGLIMFDSSERVVVCNRRYMEMYGLPQDAIAPGRTLNEVLQVRKDTGTFSRGIEEYRRELFANLKTGQAVTMMVKNADGRSHRVVNAPNALGGWISTHEDMTEKVDAMQASERQKFQLDTALMHMSQGLCMFDSEQRLIVCNARYAEIYRLTAAQTEPGTSLRAILERRVSVGSAPAGSEQYINDRISEVTAGRPYETVNRLNDGRYIAVVHRPMPDGGWVATHEDVSEAKNREESFRLLFDSNPVPMWVTSRRTLKFLAVNEAAIVHYGYSREQFLAMTLLDLRPAETRAAFEELLRTLPDIQFNQNIGVHTRSDGSVINVAVMSRKLIYAGEEARLAVIHDITKTTLAENELRRTKRFIDAVIEHIPLPIIVKDVAGVADAREARFTLFNRAYEELTGDRRDQMVGRTAMEIYPKSRGELIVRADNETLRSGKQVLTSEHPIDTAHLGKRLVIARKTVIRDDDGKPQHLVTVVDDVTERRLAEQRISYLACTDSLTDLPNRATFVDYLGTMLDNASKTEEPFAILCIDLDRFKEANDAYGHLAGDSLLRQAARRLQDAAGGAFLARVGGDEFTLVVKCGPQDGAIEELANRLLATFRDEFDIDGHRLKLNLSIGCAIYPADGTDAKTLIANADAALYQAKAETRGTIRFFAAELGAKIRDRREMQRDLKLAIERGELLLHYQPQMRITSNQAFGFEALVRWQCPKRGMVPPGEFISVAEENRFIVPLGEWILREACREAASWPRPLAIAVNISPVQFHHGDLPALVHTVLLETGLAPSRLELEITEGVLIDDFSRAVSILRKLKSLGVRIAMDDFGSGYSSLSYLHSFPFDKIKIDRNFVCDLEQNHHSMAIVRAIITLGHSIGVPVLAEGVETESQRQVLAREGCDELQGYLTGRPLSIGDYAELVGGEDTRQRHAVAQ